MAAGCPVVVPNAGGVRAYADESNAWLSDPMPSAFAAAVRSATKNPAERRLRAARGHETISAHSAERATERAFGLYDSILAGINQLMSRRVVSIGAN
jgi:glycosyltransferase involved in cell wall biosynthesis